MMLFPVSRPETDELSNEQAEGKLLLEATEVSSHLALTVAQPTTLGAAMSLGQRPPGPTKPTLTHAMKANVNG